MEAPEAHTLKVGPRRRRRRRPALPEDQGKDFDEGGASGPTTLPTSPSTAVATLLRLGGGVGIRPQPTPTPPIDGVLVDLFSIAATIEAAQRSAALSSRITPAVGVIEDLLHGLTGGDVASTAVAAKAAAEGTSGVALDFASGEGVQFAEYDDADDDDDDDDAAGGFGAGFEDDGVDFADEFNPHAGYGQADRGVNGEELDMEGGAGLEWVVNSGMGGKMAWAGPSHWRFKPPKGVNRSGGGVGEGEDGEQKPKKREKGELTYDFENPGEIDEARFTSPRRSRSSSWYPHPSLPTPCRLQHSATTCPSWSSSCFGPTWWGHEAGANFGGGGDVGGTRSASTSGPRWSSEGQRAGRGGRRWWCSRPQQRRYTRRGAVAAPGAAARRSSTSPAPARARAAPERPRPRPREHQRPRPRPRPRIFEGAHFLASDNLVDRFKVVIKPSGGGGGGLGAFACRTWPTRTWLKMGRGARLDGRGRSPPPTSLREALTPPPPRGPFYQHETCHVNLCR